MPSTPKITVTIPASLKITPSERAILKEAFKTDVISVLKEHRSSVGADITNVDNPVIIVVGVASARSGSTSKTASKAAKKAGKKK